MKVIYLFLISFLILLSSCYEPAKQSAISLDDLRTDMKKEFLRVMLRNAYLRGSINATTAKTMGDIDIVWFKDSVQLETLIEDFYK